MTGCPNTFIRRPALRGNVSVTAASEAAAAARRSPFVFVVLSAVLFGLSVPFSKLLLEGIGAVPLAGLLYLGSFAGLALISLVARATRKRRSGRAPPLERKDIPWLAGATLSGGIIAPVSLMVGLNLMTGFSTSLLLNLEGVMTALIAVVVFKENSGRKLWIAIAIMTTAGVLLGWDPSRGTFDLAGLGLIVLAMVCWGADNNLTRMICTKDPVQIAQVKSLVAGVSILVASFIIGERLELGIALLLALIVGSLSYGASLVLFIRSLELLGSLRTGAFFSFGPFVGAAVSIVLLGEWLGWLMLPAGLLMATGVWLIATERHVHLHRHDAVRHDHVHDHTDGHHLHEHFGSVHAPHSHEHTHDEMEHDHGHRPDTHHRHGH